VPEYQDAMRGGGMNRRGNGIGMMSGGKGERMTDLVELGNAMPFDKEFIEQMVPHHQMAIMMDQKTLNSDRKEMQTWADLSSGHKVQKLPGCWNGTTCGTERRFRVFP
jgi:uncharacterized protein (DUF305 family)